MPPDPTLVPAYTTASPQAVAALVTEGFALPGPIQCRLLTRGFNDTYSVVAGDGQRYAARIAVRMGDDQPDPAGEVALLEHLRARGAPSVATVRARDGAPCAAADMPEGRRPLVLFRWIDGRAPELDSVTDARAQARALAAIHAAVEGCAPFGASRIDAERLIERPLRQLAAIGVGDNIMRDLDAVAGRLREALASRDPALTRLACHGDCHGLNARIDADGRAVLFDFEHHGHGYLAYDLAVHLWAQVSFGRKRHHVWRAFIEAYRQNRALAPADMEALHLFVALRHLWLMGEWPARVDQWGREALSEALFRRETDFVLEWERAHVATPLGF